MAVDDYPRHEWGMRAAQADAAMETEARHYGDDDGAHHQAYGAADDDLAILNGSEAVRRLFVEFRPL